MNEKSYETTNHSDSHTGFADCPYRRHLFCRGSLPETKNEKAAEEAKALSLFQYDADSINAITLETPDGTFHAARNADNEWELTDQDADFAINTYYLNSVANAFANLTATRNMGEATEENKSKYGLDDPTIITCSDGTSEYTVYAGKQTATEKPTILW